MTRFDAPGHLAAFRVMKDILGIIFGAALVSSCSTVFGSEQAFQAYMARLNLVGLPISEATIRLSRQRFVCDSNDKLPFTAPVVCGRYVVGWTVAENLVGSLYRSPDGATVIKSIPSYIPVTGP